MSEEKKRLPDDLTAEERNSHIVKKSCNTKLNGSRLQQSCPGSTPFKSSTAPFTAPSALMNIPRWVLHKNKVPHSFSADAKSSRLYKIDPTKVGVNYLTFEQAVNAVNTFKGKIDGIGFALDKSVAPIVCIDIDGKDNPYIDTLFKDLMDTYIEISPSGNGYHVWFIDNELEGISGRRTDGLEIYASKRYITFTGNKLNGVKNDLATHNGLTRNLIFKLFDNDRADQTIDFNNFDFNTPPDMPDDALIAAINNSNDFMLKHLLFDGKISDYKSHSEADWHCVLKLCFWTNGNAGQIERLFYNSSLADRDKWQERQDYRRRTIVRAIAAWDHQFYKPKGGGNKMQSEFTVTIDGSEIAFRNPQGYRVDVDKGIFKYETDKETDDTTCKLICSNVVIPFRSVVNVDNNLCSVELAFKTKLGWKKAVLSNVCISTTKDIVSLSKFGLRVNSLNARKLIAFFDAFTSTNEDRIKVIPAYSQIGWHKDALFVYPIETQDYILDTASAFDITKDFEPTGDRENWLSVYGNFKRYKYFRLAVAAALAAPLLKILHIRNMTLQFWSQSGNGKTAILKFADSVYKNPLPLFKFGSSSNAIEARCLSLCDLPVCVDELKVADRDKKARNTIDVFAHLIEGGASKGRATVEGELCEIRKFRTIAIITGENPLTSFNSDMGIKRRTLELHCNDIFPKTNGSKANNEASTLHTFAENNYALVGQEWIKLITDEEKQDAIRDKFRQLRDKLVSTRPDAFIDHCNLLAACATADYFFNKHILEEEEEPDSEVILEIDREFTAEEDEKDTARAFDFIIDWYNINQGYFVDANKADEDTHTVKYGWIIDKGEPSECIAIIPNVLRQALEQAGFNATKTFTELALENLIESQIRADNKKMRVTIVKRIQNVGVKSVIAIPAEALNRVNI